MEQPLKIPEFATLTEMAEFWETHDITDFETELIEEREPIFQQL